jgi:hypothetical protein
VGDLDEGVVDGDALDPLGIDTEPASTPARSSSSATTLAGSGYTSRYESPDTPATASYSPDLQSLWS